MSVETKMVPWPNDKARINRNVGYRVMNEQRDSTIRFSLRQMFGVTGFVALTLGIVSYTGSVAYGIHLSMFLIGWVMWRVLHAHPKGLIPVLLGGDFLLWVAYERVLRGSEEDFLGYRTMISVFGSLLVVFGVSRLVRVGSKKQRFWERQKVIAAAIMSILLVLWVAIIVLGNTAIARRRAADTAANNLATAKAIAMVEEVRRQTGTTPDEDTLPVLLREPLPSVRWNGCSQQIRYTRTGDTSYELHYYDMRVFLGDTIVYDSVKGWYRVPF